MRLKVWVMEGETWLCMLNSLEVSFVDERCERGVVKDLVIGCKGKFPVKGVEHRQCGCGDVRAMISGWCELC